MDNADFNGAGSTADENAGQPADAGAVDQTAQGEDQEGVSSESSTESQDSQGGVPTGIQRRINEITREKYDAQREAQYWRDLANKAREADPEPEPTPQGAKKTLADFDYNEAEFQQYVMDEARNTAVQAARAEFATENARRQKEERDRNFTKNMVAGQEAHEDFDVVVQNPSLPYTESMHEIVTTLPQGQEVLYYLGKNIDMAAQISRLPPGLQGVELAKISAKVAVPTDNLKTNAPVPPKPIKGAGNADQIYADNPESDNLSTSEWLKRRRKQISNRRRA